LGLYRRYKKNYEGRRMKKVAFVGSSEKWWMPYQRDEATEYIISTLRGYGIIEKHQQGKPDDDWREYVTVVSGGCPYGGVDIWAEVIAISLGIKKEIYNPRASGWKYYKERNILIAENCDVLHCIEPEWVEGMEYNKRYMGTGLKSVGRFCRRSGGIWTMEYAQKEGVETHLEVISV
jgi:hypothetical protein